MIEKFDSPFSSCYQVESNTMERDKKMENEFINREGYVEVDIRDLIKIVIFTIERANIEAFGKNLEEVKEVYKVLKLNVPGVLGYKVYEFNWDPFLGPAWVDYNYEEIDAVG